MNISRREALKLVSIGSGTLLFPFSTKSALAAASPQIGKFQQPLRLPNDGYSEDLIPLNSDLQNLNSKQVAVFRSRLRIV